MANAEGAITGNGGGALEGGGKAGATGGGVDPTAGATLGGIGIPSPDTAGGEIGRGTLGFSLNRPVSAPAAAADGIEGAGFNGSAGVGTAGESVAPTRSDWDTGAFVGAGGVTKSGGDGAMMCGLSIAGGGETKTLSGGGAGVSDALTGGGGSAPVDAVGAMRGLKRILGTAGGSAGSVDATGRSAFGDGAEVNAGTSLSGGTPAGGVPSAVRSRGFSRSAGVDVA